MMKGSLSLEYMVAFSLFLMALSALIYHAYALAGRAQQSVGISTENYQLSQAAHSVESASLSLPPSRLGLTLHVVPSGGGEYISSPRYARASERVLVPISVDENGQAKIPPRAQEPV